MVLPESCKQTSVYKSTPYLAWESAILFASPHFVVLIPLQVVALGLIWGMEAAWLVVQEILNISRRFVYFFRGYLGYELWYFPFIKHTVRLI